MATMTGTLSQLLHTKQKLEDARMILDMLAYRLRDDGPQPSREEIRQRIKLAADKINEIVPRSVTREET